jgi:CO/xanthine dehydrogenase Mo-binding subunit
LKQVVAKMPTSEISARVTRGPENAKERLTYSGVDYVELAVDTETGRAHVKKVFGVHDCGRPINPLGVTSQINGDILQDISYALSEERVMDRKRGFMLNANLENYKIIGAREVPEIEVGLVENYIAQSSTDAAGIGESAGIITLAAAMNAQVELTSKHGKRMVGMGDFYVPPEKSLVNETVLQPGESSLASSCLLRSAALALHIRNMARRRALTGR